MRDSRIFHRTMAFFGNHLFFSLIVVTFLLYLPVFIIPFSFHNDGSIVSCKGGGLLSNFDEGHWVLMIGRPLYTVYLNLQSQMIYTVSQLSWSRIIYFIQMVLAMFMLWRFLERRCRVDVFWLWLMVLVFFFIPFNLLSFFWCEMEAVGAPTILLAGLSYYFWDAAFAKLSSGSSLGGKIRSVISAACGAIFFMMALCIYQPSALVVFVFTFARILFSRDGDKRSVRGMIVRDILFYGILMVVYLWLVKAVIMPLGTRYFQMTTPGGVYSFSLINNVFSKLNLFAEIFAYSLRGSLDLIGSGPGTWILVGLVIVALIPGRENIKKFFQRMTVDPAARGFFIERVVWGLFLISLANAPLLLAGGCAHILGYRVLLPSTMMFTMVIFKLFMSADSVGISRPPNVFWTTRHWAAVFTLAMVAASVWIEVNVVRNNHLENVRAKEQLRAVDFSKVNRLMFLLNPSENKTLTGQILPWEMGYMSASKNHAAAYLSEALKEPRIAWPLVEAAEVGQTVYLTPKTGIIDLTIDRKSSVAALAERDVVILNPLSSMRDEIVISATDDKETGVLLTFKTGENGKFSPFWMVNADEQLAILQIDCLRHAKALSKYILFVEARDAQGAIKNVVCRLQGSNDGKSWVNLDVRKTNLVYNVTEAKVFKHYRFLWGKERQAHNMYIHALKLLLT